MRQFNSILSYLGIILLVLLIGCNKEHLTTIDSFDGVKVSFDNEGKGEPAIILVHGWSNTRSIWTDQVLHFSEKYKVIAVDLPGFGDSGNDRNDWTMQSYGKDISSIIRELNLNKVVLVGFSMGSPVVIEASIAEPEKVAGVVIVDSFKDVEGKISPHMIHFRDSVMMDLVKYPTKEKLIKGGFVKHNIDSSFQRVVTFLDGASHIGWRESHAKYFEWINESCTNSIQSVKAPIIAINSDSKPTNVEAFRKYAPKFKAKIVKDVGHVIMWDDNEQFNKLLEESIQEFMSVENN